nr:MAG TPA: DNA-directed RNA polymerase II subunit [Caudoviricetes sp.]
MNKVKPAPYTTKWYMCPICGKRLVQFDNTTKCEGIYLQCKRCREIVEIKIK